MFIYLGHHRRTRKRQDTSTRDDADVRSAVDVVDALAYNIRRSTRPPATRRLRHSRLPVATGACRRRLRCFIFCTTITRRRTASTDTRTLSDFN